MRIFVSILLACLLAFDAPATIYFAATANRADVVAKINLTVDGDTVVVPAGLADYTQTVFITNAITLLGAGVGKTKIYDDIIKVGGNNENVAIFSFDTQTGGAYELSGFSFLKGTNRVVSYNDGTVQAHGQSQMLRIDNCEWDFPLNQPIKIQGVFGVIDHCTFYGFNSIAIFIGLQGWGGPNDLYGDYSWSVPYTFGTSNAMYVEDCVFVDTGNRLSGAIDSQFGGRWVVRHNLLLGPEFSAHGTETGGRRRGNRAAEIYDNTEYPTNNPVGFNLRSGTAIMTDNTLSPTLNGVLRIDYNRATDPFQPWGGLTGFNGWDGNVPGGPFASGTHNGGNGLKQLVDTTQNWTVNQFVGFNINNSNSGLFSLINSNTATTIYYMASVGHAAGQVGGFMAFTNGDAYSVYHATNGLDMGGRGVGNLVSGDSPTPVAWPNEATEPIYCWNNTPGNLKGVFTTYPLIVTNRDYFNSAMPGYTKFTYPHPLTGLQPPVPPNISSQPQDTLAYVGSPATFNVVASGNALFYQWNRGGANISGATTNSYTLNNCQLTDSGSGFQVVITNTAGSATSRIATLTVTLAPVLPAVVLSGKLVEKGKLQLAQ